MIFKLFAEFSLLISLAWCTSYYELDTAIESHACSVVESDNSSCVFNRITDSYTFYRELLKVNFKNVSSITRIGFSDCYLDNLPKELFSTYKSLEVLDASFTNLERFEHYDILSSNKLITFNVSNNKITKLGSRLTSVLQKMVTLDLSHNLIYRINPTAFSFNENFKVLNMSHNRIERLERDFLYSMRNLEVMRFDHNKISEILGSFDHVDLKWKELYLRHNHIKEFSPSLAKSVSYLDLSLNSIKEARFKDTKISELIISENELVLLLISVYTEKLDASQNEQNEMQISFESNRRLKHLDLSETKLKSKQDIMRYLKMLSSLQYLDLSNTKVLLESNTFRGLESLETLKLKSAIVEQIPKNAFLSLKALKQLDISENELHSFDINELKSSSRIELLNVRHSLVYKLSGWNSINVILPNLKEIDAYENKFNCKDIKNIIIEWEKMNLTIVDYDVYGSEYFSDSCINDEVYKKLHPVDVENDEISFVAWFLAVVLVLFAVVGVVFAMQKWNVIGRIKSYGHSGLLEDDS